MHQMTESKELPGFYEIPGFSNYIINFDGVVYNSHRKRYSKNTDPKGSSTFTDDIGKCRRMSKTRLLTLAKHGKPHNDDFVDFENLPYSKSTKNNDKVWAISPNRPFIAKCLITGIEWEFVNLQSLCDDFGLSFTTTNSALSTCNPSVFRGYIQVYQENKSDIENLIPYSKNANLGNGHKKIVCINDLIGSITIYPDLKSVSLCENFPVSTIKYYLKSRGLKSINSYRFVYYDDLHVEFKYKDEVK